MPIEDESGSRRQQIVTLLMSQGPMTIAELADAMGVAKTSLRPQVDRLLLQGWLDRDRRRQGPGRPADVFSASDQSRRHSAQQTMGELARLFLEEMDEIIFYSSQGGYGDPLEGDVRGRGRGTPGGPPTSTNCWRRPAL